MHLTERRASHPATCRCMSYLQQTINFKNRALAWIDGNKHPGMLNYPGAAIFGRNFKGSPDVVVATRTAARTDLPNIGLRLLLELKKKICKQNVFQSCGILLAANLHCPDFAPIVVRDFPQMGILQAHF